MSTDNERDRPLEASWRRMAELYHAPPETPRDAMWTAIEARLGERPTGGGDIVDLEEARARRVQRSAGTGSAHRFAGWAVAAAALVVMGIGIGRMTVPEGDAPAAAVTASVNPPVSRPAGVTSASLAMAAREHFGETESLLTMVRADARAGQVDPATRAWAEGLLGQTRLLLDTEGETTPAVHDLLLDLELVLIQIVGVSETGSSNEAQARTELELALRSLEEGELLPRIQAVVPPGMAGL
jgi:hypothetical protein